MNKKQLKKIKAAQQIVENSGYYPNALNGLFNSHAMNTKQLSKLGTIESVIRGDLISNNRNILNYVYAEIGICQAVVDVPVDDAFRGGVTFTADEISPEEQSQVANEVEERDDLEILSQAFKWSRLFGGGAILVITDELPELPLEMKNLYQKKLSFADVDLWELTSSPNSKEMFNDWDADFYYYRNMKFHKSRVIKVRGSKSPSLIRPRMRGWGLSVMETLVRSINQFLKTNDLTFEVLDEFKLDIFKIKGYNTNLANDMGREKIKYRVQSVNEQKNYLNAMTMDADDSYEQKQLNFAGISEVMRSNKEQIASDLRMPITKIFGTSAGGFSSGEDEIKNYNSMVESAVRKKAKFIVIRIFQLRCAQMFGTVPENIKIEFKPLEIIPENLVEEVKDKKFNRLMQALDKGVISDKMFIAAVNKEALLPINIEEEDIPELLNARRLKNESESANKDSKKGSDANKNPASN